MIKFWKDLINKTFECTTKSPGEDEKGKDEIEEGQEAFSTSFITFQNGVLLGTNEKEFYIRSCYVDLCKILFETPPHDDSTVLALLLGTPGIGKSIFLNYVLYYIATNCPRPFCVRYERRNKRFIFRSDGSVSADDEFEVDYYLCDSVVPDVDVICKFALEVSSPRKENWGEWAKRLEEVKPPHIKHNLVMPPWSFDELRFVLPSQPDLSTFYALWGGCIRKINTMITTKRAPNRWKPNEFIEAAFKLWPLAFSIPAKRVIARAALAESFSSFLRRVESHGFLDAAQITKDENSSAVIHWDTGYPYDGKDEVFASKFIATAVALWRQNAEEAFFNHLKHIGGNALIGWYFEACGHICLSKGSQTPFRLISLNGQPDLDLVIPPETQHVVFEGLSDLSRIAMGQYALPHARNFPAIDSLYLPFLFQFTVSKNHSKNIEHLEKICQEIQQHCPHPVFVWVLPAGDVFDSYVSQGLPIPEYKMAYTFRLSPSSSSQMTTTISSGSSSSRCCKCIEYGTCQKCQCKSKGRKCANCRPGGNCQNK